MIVRVESADRVDRSTRAVDYAEAEFRIIETSLHQVLRRTTANEPLRVVQPGEDSKRDI